ncbi:MAG: sugar phosphate nucleotidyltransferase, partial [Nitrososphaerales archaeon]
AEHPQTCGVLTVDETGRMVGYAEKPDDPAGDLANAGIYAFTPRVFELLNGHRPLDIGYHLMPALVGCAQTVEVTGYFRDVGTLRSYEHAQHEWSARAGR